MKIQQVKHETNPYLIIDDYYSPDVLEGVWKELDFYCHTELQNTDQNPVAINDGVKQGDMLRIPMDHIYTPQGGFKSLIFGGLDIIRQDAFHKSLDEVFAHVPYSWYNWYNVTNFSNTLISYYEDGHYYKPHFDTSYFTILIWLYKEPKNFTGGDFHIYHKLKQEEPISTVEVKNNRMIIFPSFYTHGVDELKVIDKNRKDKWGRFAITHFLTYKEELGFNGN
jgi:hypothetical protein